MLNSKVELTNEQIEKKKKMLLDMKNELDDLKHQSKYYRIRNIEIYWLRLLKILLYIIKKVSPAIAVAVVTFFISKYINMTPFLIDEKEQKLAIQKEFDSRNNIRYEMQYDEYLNTDRKIQVFGEWKQIDEEYYEREVMVYIANDISIERIIKIIEENKLSLNSVFGPPTIVKTERRNNLSIDDINSPSYVQATIYSESDDTIIVKEGSLENAVETLAWLLLNMILDGVILSKLSKEDQETFNQYVRRINSDYAKIDPVEIEKLIKIKQDNYDRLVR